MSNTIQADQQIENLTQRLTARGLRAGKAFRRFCASLRHAAMCRDLEIIRAECMASRPMTWQDA